ncbi:unnamed protein product [Alopecurus aequalis]
MDPLRVHAAAALCSATLLLSILLPAHAQNTTTPPACDPAACGDLRIAFPFWLDGTHRPECGHHAFQVTCTANRTASLRNSFLAYHILDISYNHTCFTLANANVGDGACDVDKLSVNASSDLALGPFSVSATNQELFLLYNCTEVQPSRPPPPAWAPVSCANGLGSNASATSNLFAWLAGAYRPDDAWTPVEGNCTVSMMPVRGYEGASGKDYRRLMNGGFLLNYTADDCAACMDSGGRCRVNTTNDAFECLCADGTVSDRDICVDDGKYIQLIFIPSYVCNYLSGEFRLQSGMAGYFSDSDALFKFLNLALSLSVSFM